MNHSELTIVTVYGHNSGASAIPSIVKSMTELPGSRGLLLSVIKPDDLPEEIEWKHIYPFNYNRYSVFMMHSLYAFIETEYCLVVQDDGWVLNGKNFKPEFYNYDYIGSPGHCALTLNEKAEITGIYLNFRWTEPEFADVENLHIVQNGGFSLRSKRFLESCNKHGLPHWGVESIPMKQPDGTDKPWKPIWNEDVHLTALFKPKLEKIGYSFAPLEVAKSFSIEYLFPALHTEGFDVALNNALGQHGPTRKLVTLNEVHFKKHTVGIGGEHHVVNWFIENGYKVKMI